MELEKTLSLEGRFRIVKCLGEGGYGAVYQAEDTALGRLVAIKILRTKELSDREYSRFEREAKGLSKLNHAHIVHMYSFGITDDRIPYCVTEFVPGQNLRQVLGRQPMELARICTIVQQLAQALEYCHSRDIVHRDLKPENVIVGSGDAVKLIDFGLLKLLGDEGSSEQQLTLPDTVVGTVSYISPEMCKREPFDQRADVYSLGCMIYEMLTGVPPHVGPSTMAILYAHITAQAIPVSQHNESYKTLDAIVERALAKQPDARYPSAMEFVEEFSAAAKGISVRAHQEADANQPVSMRLLNKTRDLFLTSTHGMRVWNLRSGGKQTSRMMTVSLVAILLVGFIIALFGQNIQNIFQRPKTSLEMFNTEVGGTGIIPRGTFKDKHIPVLERTLKVYAQDKMLDPSQVMLTVAILAGEYSHRRRWAKVLELAPFMELTNGLDRGFMHRVQAVALYGNALINAGRISEAVSYLKKESAHTPRTGTDNCDSYDLLILCNARAKALQTGDDSALIKAENEVLQYRLNTPNKNTTMCFDFLEMQIMSELKINRTASARRLFEVMRKIMADEEPPTDIKAMPIQMVFELKEGKYDQVAAEVVKLDHDLAAKVPAIGLSRDEGECLQKVARSLSEHGHAVESKIAQRLCPQSRTSPPEESDSLMAL